jgi:acyl-CoA synthetase (AMP-forming)/AMP-acid ligase II
LFDAIRFHSRLNPELPGLVAFDSSARELSYADIGERVDAATHQLAQSDLTPRLRIGVHCHDRLLHIIAVLALSRIGDATFVFASDGTFASGSIDVLVTDKDDRGGRIKTVVLDPLSSKCSNSEHAHTDRAADTNWQFNGITLGGQVLRARIAQRSTAKAAGGATRWLCAVDIRTELGLSAVIECLWNGGLVILSNGTFSDDVLPIRLYEADHLFVGGEQASGYLNDFNQTNGMSARLRSAVIAGASLDGSSVELMKRLITPDTVLHLDLPETGTFAACSYWQIGKPRRYWPLPGVELRLVANGQSAEANLPAHVAIKSDGVLRSAKHDDARGRFHDGWFHSTLAGSFAHDGALILS